MLAQAKTIILVTAITLVVWLFAESESVRSRDFVLSLKLPSDPAGAAVLQTADALADREEVRVTVSGAAVALAALQAAAARPIELSPEMEGMPTTDGEIDFRRVLRALPLFASRGVSITRCDPPSVKVLVDRIVQRPGELRVSIEGLGVETDGPPVVVPRSVRISGPERVLRELANDAAAVARPAVADQARLVPGRADKIVGVQLEVPHEISGKDRFVRMDPPRVDIDLTVKSKLSTHTLPNVPVQVMLPALVAGQWEVSAEQTFFSDVAASGPSALIEQLRRGEIRVFAVVALSADELEQGAKSKEAVFTTIPPSALAFKLDNPIVKVAVKRRKPEAPAKPDGSN